MEKWAVIQEFLTKPFEVTMFDDPGQAEEFAESVWEHREESGTLIGVCIYKRTNL